MVYLDPDAMVRLGGSCAKFAFPARRDPGLAASFRRLLRAVQDPTGQLAAEEELAVLRRALDDRPRPQPQAARRGFAAAFVALGARLALAER